MVSYVSKFAYTFTTIMTGILLMHRLDSLKHSGVAGMKEFSGVKCLHTHYAHHLARPEHGNVIGTWVHELLLLKEQDNLNTA